MPAGAGCEHLFDARRLRPVPPLRARRRRRPREALLQGPAALAPEPGRGAGRRGSAAAEGFASTRACAWGRRSRAASAGARTPRSGRGAGRLGARPRHASRPRRGGPARPPRVRPLRGRGLRRLHGGSHDGVLDATREALRRAGRRGPPGRRTLALLRAWPPPSVRARVARGRADADGWPPSPSRCCATARSWRRCPRRSSASGRTLGALAALPCSAVADRFGRPGLPAHDLAGARHAAAPAQSRRAPGGGARARGAASGTQLERALELLVDRLLARRERRGRTLRAVVLGATLVEGGTWRERVVFREPLADPGRMRLALGRRLALLPAPAESAAPERRALRPAAAAGAACSTTRAPGARRACARRSARRAPSPAPRPRCACSPSTPTRASPSAARS